MEGVQGLTQQPGPRAAACNSFRRDPQGFGRRRPSFSVPLLRRGLHRPAAAALRSRAGDLVMVGLGTSPRLRWPNIRPR